MLHQTVHSAGTPPVPPLPRRAGAKDAGPAVPPAVCIVLPVFRPDPAFLTAQLASIAAQTMGDHLTILVVADATSGEIARRALAQCGLAAELVDPGTPMDAPRAFETGLARALLRAGPDTRLALCDQDDLWHPARLEKGMAALDRTGAALAHSDARLVDAAGGLLHPSLFRFEGRHRRPGPRGLLLRNSVTGMTAMMTRRLAEIALPFPPQNGVHFYHDLWLALLAETTGGVHLIAEPLVDYRQHGGNVMGALDRRHPPRPRMALPGKTWLRREAAGYALARYLAQSAHNRLADAVASGLLRHGEARVAPLAPYLARSRGAGRFLADAAGLALTGHLRLARMAAGRAAVSVGRSVWALRRALGPGYSAAADQFDDRLYSLSPGMTPVGPRPASRPAAPAEQLIDNRKTPAFRPDFTAPDPAVTVLLPTLNPTEVFAGITTAIDLGLGLAEAGRQVRFVATDLPVFAMAASERMVLGRLSQGAVAQGTAGRISLHCGRSGGALPAHRGDTFLATAWWTAHVARHLMQTQGYDRQRFVYLIQDYEPQFYPWGPEFADALASYDMAFLPVFNTTLLRDYFGLMGHRFARPDAPVFHPAIDIARYARGLRRPRRGPRRIAVYGRPEVARNMFPTAVEALGHFIASEGPTPDQVEFLSVGLLHDPVALPGGHVLHSLGKLPLADYPDWLLTVDIGLSLMLSPHPSHPPLEMAAAGARVVTNRFANKDLGRLSPAVLSVEGTAQGVAAGLARAWTMGPVSDVDRWIDIERLGDPLPRLAADLALRLDLPGLGLAG